MEKTEIYGLYCPDTGALRYIGKANCSKARLKSHIQGCKGRKGPVQCWLASLLAASKRPIMEVIKTVPRSEWEKAERYAIATARKGGVDLLNVARGGNQPDPKRDRIYIIKRELGRLLKQGRVSEETKQVLRLVSARRPDIFPNWANI